MSIQLSKKIGADLKLSRPKSVKTLQKFLMRDIKSHKFIDEEPYTCGCSNMYPQEVAWCVEWLNASGKVEASFHIEGSGWQIIVYPIASQK